MSNWKQDMVDRLTSGEAPTVDDLEAALHGALEERNAIQQQLWRTTAERNEFQKALGEMTTWLGKISSAFMKGESDKVTETLAAFVEQCVKPAMTEKGACQ